MKKDPYQLLFPVGLLLGLMGAGVWIPFGFGLMLTYPGTIHSEVMMGGFLFTFAAGFLMTAIPRFTGGEFATSMEKSIALVLSFAIVLTSWVPQRFSFHIVLFVFVLFLMIFCVRRFLSAKFSPPPSFAFVGVGLLSGLFGVGTYLLGDFRLIRADHVMFGRALLYQGMMLSLVLGVGGRLVPALLGWGDLPMAHRLQSFSKSSGSNALKIPTGSLPWVLLALMLVGSFVVEYYYIVGIGRWMRAFVVTTIALWRWKLYRLPAAPGRLAYWIWISGGSLMIGYWVYALSSAEFSPHVLHLVFVSGFGLMTLLIASRVTLSHGGYGVELEQQSRVFPIMGWLVLIAAFTRVTAPWVPRYYLHHLAYASLLWVLGLAVWGVFMIKKIIGK